MNQDDLPDDLLGRLRQRDQAVIAQLITRHGARLESAIRSTWQGISDQDVEEVMADVIADAWFRADEVDPSRASLAAWLAMRARYRTLDRIRLHRRRMGLVSRLSQAFHPPVVDEEYASELDIYLGALNELERTLVWLRFVEGCPVAEIAARCGLTPKATERRLARLRDRLRKLCAPEKEMEVTGHA